MAGSVVTAVPALLNMLMAWHLNMMPLTAKLLAIKPYFSNLSASSQHGRSHSASSEEFPACRLGGGRAQCGVP